MTLSKPAGLGWSDRKLLRVDKSRIPFTFLRQISHHFPIFSLCTFPVALPCLSHTCNTRQELWISGLYIFFIQIFFIVSSTHKPKFSATSKTQKYVCLPRVKSRGLKITYNKEGLQTFDCLKNSLQILTCLIKESKVGIGSLPRESLKQNPYCPSKSYTEEFVVVFGRQMPLALPPREQWTPGVEFDEEHVITRKKFSITQWGQH